MMSKYMMIKWERKRWNGSYVERGSSEEAMAVNNGLMLEAYLFPEPGNVWAWAVAYGLTWLCNSRALC